MLRALSFVAIAAFSNAAMAQVQVVESEAVEVGGATGPDASAPVRAQQPPATSYPATGARSSSSAAASGSGRTAELFHQLQMLQVEVQELRGLVEEQSHLINRLTRDQKNQYLDLDRRVALLSSNSRPSTSSPSSSGGGGAASSSPAGSSPGASPATGSASERDAYAKAFNLTKDKRFEDAIDAFNQLIVEYPNGQYTPNAFYWLGELYLALPEPELEKSRQSFAQVVNLYPSHQKVPDSLYKLGVVYYRLGESERAISYLDRVQSDYPTSPAARLAKSYAAELR
jgi:tol-pal system protein YbgF